jgi:AraC-like DNA-binding protein
LGVPVRFGASAIGVAVPWDEFSAERRKPIATGRRLTIADVFANAERGQAGGLGAAIRSIIGLRLLDGDTDIDGAALLAGLGPRSLQRTLQDEGFTYRKILDAVRLQRSAALLQETDETVTEIALSLGYVEPGNFTRAFHRWTGRSPIDFRRSAAKVGGALAMQNLLVAYPNNLKI